MSDQAAVFLLAFGLTCCVPSAFLLMMAINISGRISRRNKGG